MYNIILTALFFTCPIAAFLLTVRLIGAIFSPKIRDQIKKQPMIHVGWGCFGYIGTFGFFKLVQELAK